MAESKITYILEAAQATAAARALSGELAGIDKAAKTSAVGASASLTGVEKAVASTGAAAVSADPKIAALFASLSSMKGELAGLAPVAEKAATAVTGTATSSTLAATALSGLATGWALAIPLVIELVAGLIALATAKKAQIEIDTDIVRLNADINAGLETGTLFTAAYARVLHDQNAIKASNVIQSEKLRAAEQAEADAIRKQGEEMTANKVISTEMYFFKRLLGGAEDQLTESVARQSVARQKEEDETLKAMQAAIQYGVAQGQTRQQVEANTAAQYGQGTALQILSELYRQATDAVARFAQGQSIASRVKLQAADAGQILTRPQLLQREKEAVANLTDTERKLYEAQRITAANQKTLNDEHIRAPRAIRSNEAAVRSYANTLVDLRKRAADAEAALSLDSLSLQQFRITTQIQREREHLAINKKDKVEALRLLDQIERDMLAGTLRAAADANKQAQERARDQRLKHLKEIERMETEHNKVLLQQYMNRLQQQDRLDRQDAAAKQAGRDFLADKAREEIARGAEIELRFARGAGSLESVLPDSEKVQQAIGLLNELGLTVGEVDAMYGSTSHSIDQLITRMELLNGANISAIDSFVQMIDLQQVMVAGIRAFTNAISGAIAGTQSLGRALLIGFLTIISEIAITLGTLFTLAAAGFLFIPGLNWSSGALFAAGAALLAFGAVLGGVALKLGQEKATSSGASGGAASGGGAAAGTTQSGPTNNIIPFPTSGTGPMTITVINRFDKGGLKAAMKGEDFVQNSDILTSGSRTARAIKKAG